MLPYEGDADSDDPVARWAAEVARIRDLPESEQPQATSELFDGIAPEDRDAFAAFLYQSRAHAKEMQEFYEQLGRDAYRDA